MIKRDIIVQIFILLSYLSIEGGCRIHRLELTDDYRRYVALSSFGFLRKGRLDVKLEYFHYEPESKADMFGFTLDRVLSGVLDTEVNSYRQQCFLKDLVGMKSPGGNTIYFVLDISNKRLGINCSASMSSLQIFSDTSSFRSVSTSDHINLYKTVVDEDQSTWKADIPTSSGKSCINLYLPLEEQNTPNGKFYNATFTVYIPTEAEEGLYMLYFHNCANYNEEIVKMGFTVEIEERNFHSYLSAGEMSLPTLYFSLCCAFFVCDIVWTCALVRSRHRVYKLHYLMGLLVYLKTFSLLFHGISYKSIEVKGEHVAPWAMLYYCTHLLKGALLFTTLLLIGSGWNFVKHILSKREKRVFMIVLPLQVFANVAEIVIDELEEGDAEYKTWFNVFILVDLICCLTILFPIIWSIRHLQQASSTDGKAAISLKKLKLFRRFYVNTICYIYFTRIIVHLLKMTVPFQYGWLDEAFKELTTLVFFVVIGYTFRPASTNPYFEMVEEDYVMDDVIISQCGFKEGLTKLTRISNEMAEDDKDTLLIFKRETAND